MRIFKFYNAGNVAYIINAAIRQPTGQELNLLKGKAEVNMAELKTILCGKHFSATP